MRRPPITARMIVGSDEPRIVTPTGTPIVAPARNGHSTLHLGVGRNTHPATPCTSGPNAIVRVTVWIRRCRSEEHTSELQSPDHIVCRLLLEKKNRPMIMQLAPTT